MSAVTRGCRWSKRRYPTRRGRATLHVPAVGYLGTATLVDQRDGHDAIVSELGLEAIHLIKCDVEGHELDVLHGARQVLERDRPSLLVESVDDRPAPGQTARVFGFLRELGYRGYYFAAGEGNTDRPVRASPGPSRRGDIVAHQLRVRSRRTDYASPPCRNSMNLAAARDGVASLASLWRTTLPTHVSCPAGR